MKRIAVKRLKVLKCEKVKRKSKTYENKQGEGKKSTFQLNVRKNNYFISSAL